jgi:hypothetical protein
MQFLSIRSRSLQVWSAGVVCLFSVAAVSRAQANESVATPIVEAASDVSDNAAGASLERAMVRAVTVKFAPAGFETDDDSEAGGGAFSTDEILLAQIELPQMLAQNQGNQPPPKPNPSEPNLGDLGFPNAQTQGSAQDQARLDKRSHMLKIHQRLGLITTIPLAATLITSGLAGGHSTSSTGRDLHATLGTITAGMYITTAYYAIFAPRIAGTKTRGPIRLHKALAFIHGPGMILTPILGAMAFDQKNAGEKVHGIASAHGAVAAITGIAYGLAIVSESVQF